MRDYGGNKDQWRSAQRQHPALAHGGKYLVGGPAAVGVKAAVQKGDRQAAQRQKVQQPAVRLPQGVGAIQRQAERPAQRAGQAAGQHGQGYPFGAYQQVTAGAAQCVLQGLHTKHL